MTETDVLIRALTLCNESRSRLTRFAVEPVHWINEAAYELEQEELKNAEAES